MKLPYTRREFAKLALTALPAISFLSASRTLRAAGTATKPAAKPNSKFAGVQVGLNVPYSFGGRTMAAEEILTKCQELNLSAVELRAQPVEGFLGLPPILVATRIGTSNARTAPDNNTVKIREWRRTVSMDRVQEFRRIFEDGGVNIEILKVDDITKMSDEEIDYNFAMAQALGARAISTEIPRTDKEAPEEIARVASEIKRLGSFADKHRLMVGYHGHTHSSAADFEAAFALARYNGANLDIGHYVAGGHGSPVAFIQQHHDRITHIHVKDRKAGTAGKDGPNVPFGEGDTPITEVLRLIRDNQWNIQATIEFEYPVPAGSNRMTEIARTVKYCRDALV